MSTDTPKPLPCPFCGGPAFVDYLVLLRVHRRLAAPALAAAASSPSSAGGAT